MGFAMQIVDGIELGVAEAGIKYVDRKDLLLIKAASGTSIAGVFTQNAFCAASVQICQSHLASVSDDKDIYLLVNTGNANAGTGASGYQDAIDCCQAVADKMDCAIEQVFPFSTGVIGEPLAVDKIISGIDTCISDFDSSHWASASEAILTTDTRPKLASRTLDILGSKVQITGISKGSGMIRPDMATMLAYICTDLKIEKSELQLLLKQMTDLSFNRISVDGDTSTNDSCMLLATGKTLSYSDLSVENKGLFIHALSEVFEDLAKAIILDGEGATKLINVKVNQGQTEQECLDVAYTIAHSPLVKTAFFACDPNWGRILAAVGRSGIEKLDIDAIEIYLNDVCIVKNGGKASTYIEQDGQAVMDQDEISIIINLARGDEQVIVWTCDFSYDYVKINAEYRT